MSQIDPTTTPAPDPVMERVAAGVLAGQRGERAEARAILAGAWDDVGGERGDPLHRCSIAHSLADVQDDLHDELVWDERALAAGREVTDERVRHAGMGNSARGLLPSLHLNLADVHRRLGHHGAAVDHARSGHEVLDALPDDGYGRMIRAGLDQIRTELEGR